MRTENTSCLDRRELQLLWETRDFKEAKVYAGVGWESIRDKYENNRETFVSNLPKQTASKEWVK